MLKKIVVATDPNPEWMLSQLQHIQYMEGTFPPTPYSEVVLEAPKNRELNPMNTEKGDLVVLLIDKEHNTEPLAVFHKWISWRKLE